MILFLGNQLVFIFGYCDRVIRGRSLPDQHYLAESGGDLKHRLKEWNHTFLGVSQSLYMLEEKHRVKSSFLTYIAQRAIRIQPIFSRWGKQVFNKGFSMARALRITFPDAFYHVTSRGNERKAVFKSKRDREKLLEYLASATQRYDALIHAYCMMDTHYPLSPAAWDALR